MSTTSEIIGLLTGFSVIFILTLCLFIFAGLILTVVGKWKVFKKAGKNGWEALIPYYNTWVLCEIADIKWWFFLIIIAGSLLSGSSIAGGVCYFLWNRARRGTCKVYTHRDDGKVFPLKRPSPYFP